MNKLPVKMLRQVVKGSAYVGSVVGECECKRRRPGWGVERRQRRAQLWVAKSISWVPGLGRLAFLARRPPPLPCRPRAGLRRLRRAAVTVLIPSLLWRLRRVVSHLRCRARVRVCRLVAARAASARPPPVAGPMILHTCLKGLGVSPQARTGSLLSCRQLPVPHSSGLFSLCPLLPALTRGRQSRSLT